MTKKDLINSFDYSKVLNLLDLNSQSDFNSNIQNNDCSFKLELKAGNKKVILKIPLEFLNIQEQSILFKVE